MSRSILRAVGLWTGIGAVLQPISCSSDDCNGPGGLCIPAPEGETKETGGTGGGGGEGASSGDAGAPSGGKAGSRARGGAGGSSAGDGGSDDAGRSGEGGESTGGVTGGTAGRGGTSTKGGSAGEGGEATGGGGNGGKAGGAGKGGGTGPELCHPAEDFQPTCEPPCPYTSDGQCDEPEGTGICAEGTDVSDCGGGGQICATPRTASPGWCDVGSGGVGAPAPGDEIGPGGGPSGTPTYFPVDDYEDGDTSSLAVFGAKGGWYAVNDCGPGLQFPLPCATPSPGNDGSTHASAFAMRTFGTGFLPRHYAQLGVAFRSNPPACDGPLDASAADGVSFWAKGAPAPIPYQAIRFSIGTVATNPTTDNGTCTSDCWNAHGETITVGPDWHQYFVRFGRLQQEWGIATPFDRSKILGFIWAAREQVNEANQAGCFDFWIDDVAFFHD